MISFYVSLLENLVTIALEKMRVLSHIKLTVT